MCACTCDWQVSALAQPEEGKEQTWLSASLTQMVVDVHADMTGYCLGALKVFWQPLDRQAAAPQQVRLCVLRTRGCGWAIPLAVFHLLHVCGMQWV